jgi:hypothetical protein
MTKWEWKEFWFGEPKETGSIFRSGACDSAEKRTCNCKHSMYEHNSHNMTCNRCLYVKKDETFDENLMCLKFEEEGLFAEVQRMRSGKLTNNKRKDLK